MNLIENFKNLRALIPSPGGAFCWRRNGVGFCITTLLFIACSPQQKENYLFEVLDSKSTGLDFANNLNSTDSFNLFKYMYFYNGAGVGAGDFNNDGLMDVFFASNQGNNSLYLNKGSLKFRNATKEANIPNNGAWSTGVSIIDINNDGLLDIYISGVGDYMMLKSHNQFLICQGISSEGVPQYVDKAKEMGLDFSGFGTQAAFIDFDMDGDLDVFLLNHSIHHSGNFRERSVFTGTFHPTSGSRFYRNDNKVFTDITKSIGINSTAIGYGLGIAISDINLDGYPDIYVGNDFHENDYMYINQKNGTFKDMSGEKLMHTSKYTMGVDVADISNDGLPEIIATDMLPEDPGMLKRSPGEDNYDVFELRINYGYSYQYSRNALQYNRGNGYFSEIGLYSGIYATDWSWSPLLLDFDNDGAKDLFISNGIPKRLNDIDYINYISNESIQQQIIENKINEKDRTLIDKFPRIKIPNKFFRNSGKMSFENIGEKVSHEVSTFSNGAVYADFDNDGDLDIIVNNVDDNAILYRNDLNDKNPQPYILLKLEGPENNINALGAKVVVFAGKEIRTYEKTAVRGYMSGAEGPLHIGLGATKPDSLVIVWPDNTCQSFMYNEFSKRPKLKYTKGLPAFNYAKITAHKKTDAYLVDDITLPVNLLHKHEENKFPEFDREPLIPHMLSTEGPALAVADMNKDTYEDVFIGSSRGNTSTVYTQNRQGVFSLIPQPEIEKDSMYEDVDACWVDVNNDKYPDLVVASGGNEYYGKDNYLLPRVYINDGSGQLIKKTDAFDSIYITASCVVANDFNNDGYIDLFIGGRAVPWEYGKAPRSYLLQNDGRGKFKDVTIQYSEELQYAGFVTKAIWLDIDKDKKKDLVICSEWGTIDAYINADGKFKKRILTDKKGWWNTIVPCDINGDGNIDLLAGNLGLNSRLKASAQQPLRLYYNDFDGNGKKEQVLTYYLRDKEIPFASKSEMERQIPMLRKKFLYAKDFANASLAEILGDDKLENSTILTADYFSNCLLVNKGNMEFDVQELPWEAQLSPVRDAVPVYANDDDYIDIMLMGNYYGSNVEMGRYDACFGSVLFNDGKNNFSVENLNGLSIKGEIRNIAPIKIRGKETYIITRNNDSTMVVNIQGSSYR